MRIRLKIYQGGAKLKKKKMHIFFLAGIVILLFIKIIWILFYNNETVETYEKVSPKNVCVALTYHYIRDKTLWNLALENLTKTDELTTYTVYTDEFEKQINKLIEEKAYFATLEEVQEFRKSGNYPDKCVLICFDDGDESVYKNAFPFLKEKQIPFTMFIIAGQVGNNDFKNLKLSSWDELREMRDSGLVSFGSHTYDMHYLQDNKAQFLNEDSYEKFFKDIIKSKEVMENELGFEITSIAYPFGNTSDKVTEMVRKAGFTNAFILSPHPLEQNNDPYYQNRYLITKSNFEKILLPWLQECDNN